MGAWYSMGIYEAGGSEIKELLMDEWSIGVYHRELALPVAVNAACANVTYGNGVLDCDPAHQ